MHAQAAMSVSEPTSAVPSAQQMRSAMGTFATGVTIVSGVDDGVPFGFACQAFASVSLEPPLVLFCADHRGRAWPRIRRAGRFSASVLSERQDALCARFGSRAGLKFDGLPWRESEWGTPEIDGVLSSVHCEIEDVHVAGDHDVVIGRVLSIDHPDQRERPMIFFRGRFGLDDPAPVGSRGMDWGDRWG